MSRHDHRQHRNRRYEYTRDQQRREARLASLREGGTCYGCGEAGVVEGGHYCLDCTRAAEE